MAPVAPARIAFGPFVADLDDRRVSCGGRTVTLTPKAFDVLMALLERPGEIVEKDALIARVWVGTFVEESNLKVTISMLRKVLDEAAPAQAIIETIPRRGYRVVVPVRREGRLAEGAPVVEAPADSGPVVAAARARIGPFAVAALVIVAAVVAGFGALTRMRAPRVRSVAVLPFVNATGDAALDYLTDGLTDRLIDALAETPSLKIIAATSVFRYKGRDVDPAGIGRELGVTALLTGRVTRRQDDLLINVELVNADDNRHLWGREYRRPLNDVQAQQRVANEVSETLRGTLGGASRPIDRPSTSNVAAFQDYVRGRAFLDRRTREGLRSAAEAYQAAIAADSTYAAAYAGLADVYMNLTVRGYVSPREGFRRFDEAARRSVELDPGLPEGHALLGLSHASLLPYAFPEADRELDRAVALGPASATAHFYRGLLRLREGRIEERIAEVQTAHDLDPASAIITRQVSLGYNLKRDYTRALAALRTANDLGSAFSSSNEVMIYVQAHEYAAGRAELARAEITRKDDPILIYSRALLDAASGERAAAIEGRRALEALSETDAREAHWIAKIDAILGDTDAAFRWLDRGLDMGSIGTFYRDEPVWDTLRGDPRFAAFLSRAGLN